MMKKKMNALTAVPAVFHKRLNVTRKVLTSTTALVSAQRHLAVGIVGIGLLISSPSHANPEGGKVVEGSATIIQESAQKLNVHQHTDKAIIDWNSFNIGEKEHTQFYQPNSNSIALNRITGGDPSQILGRLTANGRVMIINPNGVLFGLNSRIDVNGLVASTHDIKNHDFMNGNYNFNIPGNPKASIINKGNISVADQGLVAFVAPSVQNQGYIAARLGKVALASANGFTLDLYGDQLINILVDDKVAELALDENGEPVEALVDNSGKITADGGYVFLTANAARSLVNKVVNNTGYVEARSVGMENGEIVLHGGDEGEVHVAGTIDASGDDTGETGGRVQITGEKVGIMAGAEVTASGESGGGTVLVGGDYLGGNGDPEIVKTYDIKLEDQAIPTAQFTYVDESAKISADAKSDGDGGKVIVWADQATRSYGEISAKGGANSGDGGFIETSGKDYLDVGQAADASAENGKGGTWLLDPRNVTITGAGVDANGTNSSNVFTATGDNATITATTIETALNAGTNIQINTGSRGAQDGNITIGADITKSAGGDATLTLVADKQIKAGGAYTISSSSNKLNMSFTAGEYNYLGWDASTETTLTSNGGDIYLDGGSYNLLYGTVNAGAGDVTIKAANTPKDYGGLYMYTGSNIYGNNITVDTAGVIWDQDTGVDWSTSIEGTGNVTLKGSQIGTGSNSLQVVGGTNSTLTLEQTDNTNNTSTKWTYIYADKDSANRKFTTINATVRDNDVKSGLSIKFDGSTDRIYVRDDGTDIGTGTNYSTGWTPDYAIDTSEYNRNVIATTYGVKPKTSPFDSYVKTGSGTFTLNMYDQPSTTSEETQETIDQTTTNTTNYEPVVATAPEPVEQKFESDSDWIDSITAPNTSDAAPVVDTTLQMLFDAKGMTDVSVLNTFEAEDGSKYMELSDGSFALIKEEVINGATAKTPVHFENGRPLSENDKELLASGWSLEDVLNKSPQDVAVLLGKEKIQFVARYGKAEGVNNDDQSEETNSEQQQQVQELAEEFRTVSQAELIQKQEIDSQRNLFASGVVSINEMTDETVTEFSSLAKDLIAKWENQDLGVEGALKAYLQSYDQDIISLFASQMPAKIRRMYEKDKTLDSYEQYTLNLALDDIRKNLRGVGKVSGLSNLSKSDLIDLVASLEFNKSVSNDVLKNFEVVADRLLEVNKEGTNQRRLADNLSYASINQTNINRRINLLNDQVTKNEVYISDTKSVYDRMLRDALDQMKSGAISQDAYDIFNRKIEAFKNNLDTQKVGWNSFMDVPRDSFTNDTVFKKFRNKLNDESWALSAQFENISLNRDSLFSQYLAEAKAAAPKPTNNQGVGITGSGMAQFNGQLQDTSSGGQSSNTQELTMAEQFEEWKKLPMSERMPLIRENPDFRTYLDLDLSPEEAVRFTDLVGADNSTIQQAINDERSFGQWLKLTQPEMFDNGLFVGRPETPDTPESTQVATPNPVDSAGGQDNALPVGSSTEESVSNPPAQDEPPLRRNPNGGKPQEPVVTPVGEDGIKIQTNPNGSIIVIAPDGQQYSADSAEQAQAIAGNIQIQITAQKIAEQAKQNHDGAENQTGSELSDGTQITPAEYNFGTLTSPSGVKVNFSPKEIEIIKGLIVGESAFTPNGEVLAQVASDIEFEGTNLQEFLKKRAIGLNMYAAYQNEGKRAAERLENALSDDTSIAVRQKLDTLAEALTVEKLSAKEIAGDVFDSLVDRAKNLGRFALDFGSSLGDAVIPEEALNAAFSSVETAVQVGQMQSSTIELIGLAAKGDIGELSKGVSDFIESAGNVALKDNKNFKAFKIAKAIAKMKESMSQANSLDTIPENIDNPNGQGVYLNSVEKVMLKTKLYADAITNLTSALVDALPENVPGLDNLKIAQSVADSVSREANTQWNDEAALFNKTMDLRIEKGKQIGQAMVGVIEELQ